MAGTQPTPGADPPLRRGRQGLSLTEVVHENAAMSLARAARPALWPAGLVVGVVSVAVGRLGAFEAASELAAGWLVIATGLLFWARRPASQAGPLLAVAGLAWLLVSWNTPAIGSAPGFAIGLSLYAVAPPLLAQAALAFPGGRPSPIEAAGLGLAYAATAGVLGLLPALVFDPAAAGCVRCPANPLLVAGAPGLYGGLNRAGIWLGLVWAPLLIGLLARQLARCTPALRTVKTPVTVTAIIYLALVTWDYWLGLYAGFLAASLRTAEAVTLVAVAAAVWWTWILARRTRAEMTRLVVELAGSPEPGKLRDMMAATLGDPALRLAYPLPDGGFVDAEGTPVTVDDEQKTTTVTPLLRDGRTIAVLTHRAGLFDDPALADEVVAGSSLALENERLQAELNAQLTELRASRARIAEAGDAERRRLERDLHDGAQQHLAALLLSVGVARIRSDNPILERAEEELRAAAAELRTLARGVFPAILADEGLAAAVESLAEETRVRIVALPARRLSQAVETAAYFVIARAVPDKGTMTVTAVLRDDRLAITLEGAGALADARDRIAALDGQLATDADGLIRVSLPCA
jgi:signal transduction histidine kinase